MKAEETFNPLVKLDRYGIVSIKRENINFLHQNKMDFDENIISKILPFGKPPTTSIKFTQYKDSKLLTIISFNNENDIGKGIFFPIDNANLLKMNLKDIINQIKPFIEADLEKLPELINLESFTEKEINDFPSIPNLDGLLFSLLAHGKIIIFGSQNTFLNLFSYFQNLFPIDVLDKITFVSQTNSLFDEVQVVGLCNTEDNKILLSKVDGINETIWIPKDNKLFAPKSSPMCKTLANLLNNNNFNDFRSEMNKFIRKVREYSSSLSIDDIMVNLDLDLNDAQLFYAVHALLSRNSFDFSKII